MKIFLKTKFFPVPFLANWVWSISYSKILDTQVSEVSLKLTYRINPIGKWGQTISGGSEQLELFQGNLSTLAGRKISVGVAGFAPALALVSAPFLQSDRRAQQSLMNIGLIQGCNNNCRQERSSRCISHHPCCHVVRKVNPVISLLYLCLSDRCHVVPSLLHFPLVILQSKSSTQIQMTTTYKYFNWSVSNPTFI